MRRDVAPRLVVLWLIVLVVGAIPPARAKAQASAALGYFRQPALSNDTLVFTAEGDLWRVPIAGGVAERLTSHYTRRLEVERASQNRIGYLHLRAMGGGDMAQWTREFYPVFNREGLIIDVRHNQGGNIDSWLLARLLRKAWFYWQPRIGQPDLEHAVPPSAVTSWCSSTSSRRRTARRSPKASAVWVLAS